MTEAEVELAITALESMDVRALRQRWRELYSTEPPPKIQSRLLRLAVAYRIQEKAFGGLKPSAKRRLLEHLEARNSGHPKGTQRARGVRSLAPGTQLLREWNGATLLVEVVADGFRWKDKTYRTLSAVAVAITGTKWSGPKFFGLTVPDKGLSSNGGRRRS